MADTDSFATFIRKRRLERGATQTELARNLHLSVAAVSRWENGDRVPEPQHLAALAKELGVPVRRLINLLFEDRTERAFVAARIRQAAGSDAA